MKTTINKMVLKYTALTLGFMLLLVGTSFLMLSLFLPRIVADVTYDLGLKDMALYYYEKNYNQTQESDDLYNALTVSVMVQNHEKTIEFFEILFESEDYETLMQEIETKTQNSDLNIVTKSALLNEDNYLKNRYVNSLLKTCEVEKAITFAKSNFTHLEFTLNNLGTYAFANILTNEHVENETIKTQLEQNYVTEQTLVQTISTYFTTLETLFNTNYENLNELTNLQKSQMLQLGKRINIVANNLNICNQMELQTGLLDQQIANIAVAVSQKLVNLM